jgi:hypothetical protein
MGYKTYQDYRRSPPAQHHGGEGLDRCHAGSGERYQGNQSSRSFVSKSRTGLTPLGQLMDRFSRLHCMKSHLPNLGLARNRSDLGNWLAAKCIDDARLSSVWIANQADTDLFPLLFQNTELTEKVNLPHQQLADWPFLIYTWNAYQRAATKWVLHAGPHRTSWVVLLQQPNPRGLVPSVQITNSDNSNPP